MGPGERTGVDGAGVVTKTDPTVIHQLEHSWVIVPLQGLQRTILVLRLVDAVRRYKTKLADHAVPC
jgi:hypothetical protein